MSTVEPSAPSKKVGRPRKWTSEAERKRAYRERLAGDLEAPLALRRELRAVRQQAAQLKRANSRMAKRVQTAERAASRAASEAAEVQKRFAWLNDRLAAEYEQTAKLRTECAELRRELLEARSTARASAHVPPLAPVFAPVRRVSPTCQEPNCHEPATMRVSVGRGVERDVCDHHLPQTRRRGRAVVVRRY